MLVGDKVEPKADVVVVVENDELTNRAITAIGKIRAAGHSADLMASGSARKRFDKAVKAGAETIVAFDLRDGAENMRIKADDETRVAIEKILG